MRADDNGPHRPSPKSATAANQQGNDMKRRDFLLNSTAVMGGGMLMGSFALPAAAQDTPVSGGTLIWGHSETTQNLDMHQTGTASTIRVLQNVHDAIVTVDKNLTVIPS